MTLDDRDVRVIAEEALKARTWVTQREGGISGRCAICVHELARRLKVLGYPAVMVDGTFTVDNPDPKIVPEEDFESGEAYNPAHSWIEVGDLIVDPTADQFAAEVDEDIPEVVIGAREDLDRYTAERRS